MKRLGRNINNDMPTPKRKIGNLGEDIACKFLKKRGFDITERNYLKKWGEIDIIARNEGKFYFFEVKSVTRDLSVLHETGEDSYRPEDNIHPWKLQRISKTIESYLAESEYEGDWQLDAIVVYIDFKNRKTRAKRIQNISI